MKTKPFDTLLFYLMVVVLLFVSVIASYSLTGELWQPILQGAGGLVVMFVVSKIDYQKMTKFYKLALWIAAILLILTILFGRGGGGRSLMVGGVPFQTFYIVTILYLFYLCATLAAEMNSENGLDEKRNIIRLIVFTGFTGAIAMRNISTAILLFTSGFTVFYVAGTRPKHLAVFLLVIGLAGGVYIGGSALMDRNKSEEELAQETKTRGGTGFNRIKYWLTGESDVPGYGRQMTLARTAVARSAQLPHPGKGIIKDKMPEGENDYVFSLICEELSVWVGMLLLVVYLIIFYNIVLISRKARSIEGVAQPKGSAPPAYDSDPPKRRFRLFRRAKRNGPRKPSGYFVKLFPIAIGVLFIGQVFIHIGTNINLIPATGQTLPFISRGSTTLFCTFILFGILINMGEQVLGEVYEGE
ncbi:MAG: FtsW/RodA/SpoVE family cell cycle protein [Bacteroidales bacterium]|jgi:cell division protein FtsW|nr:FtsW/RodA/SpoVE family cell cycle protein [Bacteroidales bacterium]